MAAPSPERNWGFAAIEYSLRASGATGACERSNYQWYTQLKWVIIRCAGRQS